MSSRNELQLLQAVGNVDPLRARLGEPHPTLPIRLPANQVQLSGGSPQFITGVKPLRSKPHLHPEPLGCKTLPVASNPPGAPSPFLALGATAQTASELKQEVAYWRLHPTPQAAGGGNFLGLGLYTG